MSATEPPGLFFLDTNVFVYSFDSSAPAKQQTARQLVQTALRGQRGVISTQVVQEFLNLALRKFRQPMTVSDARDYLRSVLIPLCQHYPSTAFYDRASVERRDRIFLVRYADRHSGRRSRLRLALFGGLAERSRRKRRHHPESVRVVKSTLALSDHGLFPGYPVLCIISCIARPER